MFVSDQIEIVLSFPLFSRGFHFVLKFDDILAQDKPHIQELLQDSSGDGDEVLVLSPITDQDGAMPSRLCDPVRFLCHFPHLGEKRIKLEAGEIARNPLSGVFYDGSVGRVRCDEINGIVLKAVQIPCVTMK